jgi:hypothetical protein
MQYDLPPSVREHTSYKEAPMNPKRWLCLAAVLVPVSTVVHASSPDTLWTGAYGGDTAEEIRCISATDDGGFVFSGSVWMTTPVEQSDVYVGRIDANGDSLWTTHFGGGGSDVGYAVRETPDDGFIVAGMYSAVGTDDRNVYLVKLNSMGGVEWQKFFGGPQNDEARDVQVLVGDGGYIITGFTRSFGAYGSDVYVIRTTADGDSIATHHYNYSINDVGMSICETVDAYVVCGHTQSPTDYDLMIMQTSTHLDPEWVQQYGGSGNDIGFSVKVTPVDFGFIIGGETSSFGAGGMDGWALKTDASGDTLWTRTVGDADYNRFFGADLCPDGGYAFAGQYASVPFENRKFYAAKLDAGGTLLWEQTYGPIGDECVALSMQHVPAGGFIMGGYVTWTADDNRDAFVVRLAEEGPSAVESPDSGAPPVAVRVTPNPSSGSVRVVFDSEADGVVQATICDAAGRLVARPWTRTLDAHLRVLEWDGKGLDGRPAAPGVYFYGLTTEGRHLAGSLVRTR